MGKVDRITLQSRKISPRNGACLAAETISGDKGFLHLQFLKTLYRGAQSKTAAIQKDCRCSFTTSYVILNCCPSPIWQQKGGVGMEYLTNFLVAVAASVVAYYIRKWLDSRSKGK